MEPVSISAWLIKEASSILAITIRQQVLRSTGMLRDKTGGPTKQFTDLRTSVEAAVGTLHAVREKDTLKRLQAGFMVLQDASTSTKWENRHMLLHVAVEKFLPIAAGEGLGVERTAGYPNSKLRAIAYISLAATYTLLDEEKLYARSLEDAANVDMSVFTQFLGGDLVSKLTANVRPSPKVVKPSSSGVHKDPSVANPARSQSHSQTVVQPSTRSTPGSMGVGLNSQSASTVTKAEDAFTATDIVPLFFYILFQGFVWCFTLAIFVFGGWAVYYLIHTVFHLI